jgi:hypothetical protein
MAPGVNEKDWKLFRSRIADWQEAYMDRLNREYMEILTGEGNPSDKFWVLEARIKKDKKATGVRIEMSKPMMQTNLLLLLREGAITVDDLKGFSDDLREQMMFLM